MGKKELNSRYVCVCVHEKWKVLIPRTQTHANIASENTSIDCADAHPVFASVRLFFGVLYAIVTRLNPNGDECRVRREEEQIMQWRCIQMLLISCRRRFVSFHMHNTLSSLPQHFHSLVCITFGFFFSFSFSLDVRRRWHIFSQFGCFSLSFRHFAYTFPSVYTFTSTSHWIRITDY